MCSKPVVLVEPPEDRRLDPWPGSQVPRLAPHQLPFTGSEVERSGILGGAPGEVVRTPESHATSNAISGPGQEKPPETLRFLGVGSRGDWI
jgi:hypothetical protein